MALEEVRLRLVVVFPRGVPATVGRTARMAVLLSWEASAYDEVSTQVPLDHRLTAWWTVVKSGLAAAIRPKIWSLLRPSQACKRAALESAMPGPRRMSMKGAKKCWAALGFSRLAPT
jgi:hypothetical protein